MRPASAPGPSVSFPRRAYALILALAALLGILYVFLGSTGQTNWPPVRSDGEGYFAYLPLAVVYHTADVSAVIPAQGTGEAPAGSRLVPETGRWTIKYPIGVALAAAPFYLVAHGFCLLTHLWPADGYSLPYQLSLQCAGFAALAVALWALGRWLGRRFTKGGVAPALAFLALGTNLAHYATFDAFASHVYSVAALALFLDRLDFLVAKPNARNAALVGLCAGYGFLTRNTTVLYTVPFFVLPLLAGRIERGVWLKSAAVAAGAGFLAILPQLLLWKYTMGSFLSYSYGEERFSNLLDPLFGNVLWSWRKGAFLHFPFLLLPVLGLIGAIARGSRPLLKPHEPETPPASPIKAEAAMALFCCILQTYVAASWSTWPFGGSLGHRAFVDTYPVLALGAAWLAARGIAAGRRKYVWYVVIAAVVYAQVFTQLYWFHFVKSDGMTRHDFAQLPQAAAIDLPLRFAGTFYDAAFTLRHPRNTSRPDWKENTRAVLAGPGPAQPPPHLKDGKIEVAIRIENTGGLTLKDWGRRGNILVRATATGKDGVSVPLRPKQFLPSPIDPGKGAAVALAFRLPKQPLAPGDYRLTLSLWHGQKDSLTALGLANDLVLDITLP